MSQESVLRTRAKESGRSMTRPRLALLEILGTTHHHPTAAELYDEVRKVLPDVTLATVYRNLAVLQELGLVREIAVGTAAAHYDAIVSDHCHVHCKMCGKIADVDVDMPPGWQAQAQEKTDFLLTHHSVLFEGVCPDCQAAQAMPHETREDTDHVS